MKTNNEFPTPHGNSTFTPPSLDGSSTLLDVFDDNGVHNAKHPLFHYVQDNEVHTIGWGEAKDAIHRLGHQIRDIFSGASQKGRPVVGILAVSDSITYYTTIAAIMRAGYVPFPISPRNSPAAVAHLITATGTQHVLVTKDTPMQSLFVASLKLLEPQGVKITTSDMPEFGELYTTTASPETLPKFEHVGIEDAAIILHSSGSTSFPKPITLTFRIMLEAGLAPYYGEINFSNETLSSHAVPMFHLMGAVQLPWTAIAGLTIGVFAPQTPPGHSDTRSRVYRSGGHQLDPGAWARKPDYVETLKKFHVVIYAGGPLEQSVGDRLVSLGINLAALYGSTESGPLTIFLPKKPAPEGWDYWRFSSHCRPALVPYEEDDRVYRLVLEKSPIHTPAVINTEANGKPAYDTNDLLLQHPTNPDLFKVFGRYDDQIMHSTGEKTNPVPLEGILCRSPHIAAAIMFGRSRFNAGVVILPSANDKVDVNDEEQVAAFRNKIWDTIEEANKFAPTHSRIFKEMIVIANDSKPFEYTPKGTPRRQAILVIYESEIDEAYEKFKTSTQEHIRAPTSWTPEECLRLVKEIVGGVLTNPVSDTDDLFQKGCDRQATWIRNTLVRTLTTAKVDSRALSENFVYSHPSVERLARFIVELSSGRSSTADNSVQTMLDIVERYTAGLKPSSGSVPFPAEETVLVTGTTGRLGSHILASLLQRSDVAKVYAFNRVGARSSKERQKEELAKHGLDPRLLDTPKLEHLEGDTASDNLGLQEEVYRKLSNEVTLIIHNGWRVDFNISVSSMEPLVKGTRNLVDLALSSPYTRPPSFIFISSISVFTHWKDGIAPEARLTDPQIAVHTGYSESKWCAEEVLYRVSAETNLRSIIVRIGQLSGAANGFWSTQEWFPTLVKTSQVVGGLPDIRGPISWVPIDKGAEAIIEMRRSEQQYINLANSEYGSIESVVSVLSRELDIPVVPRDEWLRLVEQSEHQSPLLAFFRNRFSVEDNEHNEALGFSKVSASKACSSSPTLKALDSSVVGPEEVRKWVRKWREDGFLQ